jgi:phosphate uptake regulator
MLFGGNDNPEADKFLDNTLSDLTKMMDNPNKFYYTSIENMKKIAIKMMKKLSKLYSLINKDKTITVEMRDPMSFEMDQLYRKITKKDNIIHTKFDEKFLKKK